MASVQETTSWERVVKQEVLPAGEGTEEGVVWKATINVNLPNQDEGVDKSLGAFVGFKGNNIRAISGKSKKIYMEKYPDAKLGYLRLHVSQEGWVEGDTDTKYVSWNQLEGCSNIEEFNVIIGNELLFCENKLNGFTKAKGLTKSVSKSKKTNAKAKPKPKTESDKVYYTFWCPVNPRFIGRMIGVEGSNVSLLKSAIKESCGIERLPSIYFNEEGRKVNNDAFKIKCKNTEFSDEETGIWISVRFTGSKSYKKTYDACQEFVDSTFVEDDDDDGDYDSMNGEADDPEEKENDGNEEEESEEGGGW